MNHCDNNEKTAAELLKKRVQSIYRYTTAAGLKTRLVPNSPTTAKIANILVTTAPEYLKIEALKVFKKTLERMARMAEKYENWLNTLEKVLHVEAVDPELRLYRVSRQKRIQMQPAKRCAYCGLGVLFPAEYEGRIVCMFCHRKLKNGLIKFPKTN